MNCLRKPNRPLPCDCVLHDHPKGAYDRARHLALAVKD